MAQAALDVFEAEFAVLENLRVLLEFNERAVGLLRLALVFLLQPALLEGGLGEFAIAMTARHENLRERIHRLNTNTKQTNTKKKHNNKKKHTREEQENAIHD